MRYLQGQTDRLKEKLAAAEKSIAASHAQKVSPKGHYGLYGPRLYLSPACNELQYLTSVDAFHQSIQILHAWDFRDDSPRDSQMTVLMARSGCKRSWMQLQPRAAPGSHPLPEQTSSTLSGSAWLCARAKPPR